MVLFTTKPGAEPYACAELGRYVRIQNGSQPGVLIAPECHELLEQQLCFSSWQLVEPQELAHGSSGAAVVDWFCEQIRSERIDAPWPLVWLSASENGFAFSLARAQRVQRDIRLRLSRVGKLAQLDYPQVATGQWGLFVVECEGVLWVSRRGCCYGQRRMKDDPQAPSRSYLKVEEAFAIFGRAPQQGQRVADLGAAPGGWSWAAARRGAEVWAVDNGPLKKAAADHSMIHHVRADAFVWTPPGGGVDWLLCDMVEQPLKVMRRVRSWLENRWCSYAVINFKYGHADALKVLDMVGSSAGMGGVSRRIVCRHLFHDREEITVMVEV